MYVSPTQAATRYPPIAYDQVVDLSRSRGNAVQPLVSYRVLNVLQVAEAQPNPYDKLAQVPSG